MAVYGPWQLGSSGTILSVGRGLTARLWLCTMAQMSGQLPMWTKPVLPFSVCLQHWPAGGLQTGIPTGGCPDT